jgi:hypothetical protein
MKFTKEQYYSMGEFCLDDLEINQDSEKMFELFNELPDNIQGIAVQWGFNDTVFRDEAFVFLVKKLFNQTVEEYYNRKK